MDAVDHGRRDHEPHGAGRGELRDELVDRARALRALVGQALDARGVHVPDHALVAGLHEAPHHVRPHPTEADHPELHGSSREVEAFLSRGPSIRFDRLRPKNKEELMIRGTRILAVVALCLLVGAASLLAQSAPQAPVKVNPPAGPEVQGGPPARERRQRHVDREGQSLDHDRQCARRHRLRMGREDRHRRRRQGRRHPVPVGRRRQGPLLLQGRHVHVRQWRHRERRDSRGRLWRGEPVCQAGELRLVGRRGRQGRMRRCRRPVSWDASSTAPARTRPAAWR